MRKNYELDVYTEAKVSINEIATYISETLSSPQAAMNLLDSIDKAFSILEQFPHVGTIIEKRHKGIYEFRRYVVKGYNYNIYYVVHKNIVSIVSIMHQSRSTDNLK